MGNILAVKQKNISPFRKVAIGTWQTAYDPSIYGTMRVRMDRALEYIDRFREKHGRKLTVTHLVAKGIARALQDCPEANAVLRFNKIYLRKTIDISLLVLMESEDGQIDLSSAKVDNMDQTSLVELVDRLEEHVAKIRARKDKALEKTRQSMRLVPAILMNSFLKILAFLSYSLNLNLTWLGIPKDAFGGAVVTSIGSIGLDIGYVPLVPYTRVPIWVAPGAVTEEPVVDNGKIVPGHMINVNATFDHRVVDGGHAAKLARTFRATLEDPFAYFDEV
jgi:pyruvate dehydrogenase E2 component (dihydrolipoamide acetyltransferase)